MAADITQRVEAALDMRQHDPLALDRDKKLLTRDIIAPTSCMAINESSPRGSMAMPACNAGYQSRVCSSSGTSTVLPYNTNPNTVIRKTPVA